VEDILLPLCLDPLLLNTRNKLATETFTMIIFLSSYLPNQRKNQFIFLNYSWLVKLQMVAGYMTLEHTFAVSALLSKRTFILLRSQKQNHGGGYRR